MQVEVNLMQQPILASVVDFARMISLSERQVRAMIARHELPVVRVGRRTLIPVDDGLNALVQSSPQDRN